MQEYSAQYLKELQEEKSNWEKIVTDQVDKGHTLKLLENGKQSSELNFVV